MQIISLSKTLESLRKEHLEYFNKATMQEQTIFTLSQKLKVYEGSLQNGGDKLN